MALFQANNSYSKSGGEIMQKGDVVKFKEPIDPGDENAIMVLEEDPDGGRVLVRHLVDMKLQPTSVYSTKDLQLCESDRQRDEA